MKNYDELTKKYQHRFSVGFWGIECDIGWYDLIEKMLEEMDIHIGQHAKISQLKQKLGALRIYADHELLPIIDRYEELSRTVCETCGAEGYMTNHSRWLRVLCKKHDEEMIIKHIIE